MSDDKKSSCFTGPFKQNPFGACDRKLSALSSYARAARVSIGSAAAGVSNLFAHKMAASSSAVLSPWPNTREDYELREIIGVGATAVVYSAYCKQRDEKCAIKRINLEKWHTTMEELLREIHAMSSCNHENVVTYYTSFVVDDELWLVLRLLEAGSLLDVIKHRMRAFNCKHGVFDESTIATVLKEVLKGLEYFHNNGQMHRDIKSGNILLGEDGTVQIGDFGVSAWLSTGADMCREKVRHTFVGTPCWMAPEVMDNEYGYDFKADIWSFGITAIEMATGTAPYYKFPPMKVLMLTLQNEPPNLDTAATEKGQYKVYGKTFRKMIVDCLQKDPAKRPTAAELLKHSFFKKAKDRAYLTQTLVAIGPSLETRVHKASRRQPGSTGLMHRTVAGEWVWEDEEEFPDEPTPPLASLPMNELQRAESASENEEDAVPLPIAAVGPVPPAQQLKTIVLRIRNDNLELNDIRFDFVVGKDSPASIATDLVGAGLVYPQDALLVALHLAQLLEAQSLPNPPKIKVFNLNSMRPSYLFDPRTLLGFAQISLVD